MMGFPRFHALMVKVCVVMSKVVIFCVFILQLSRLRRLPVIRVK